MTSRGGTLLLRPRAVRRVNLRVAARDQDFGQRTQSPGTPHQLPRFPIRAVGYRAGIDDVAIRRVVERNKRMLFLQPALNHRRIILVDLAAESGDGYAHGSSLQVGATGRSPLPLIDLSIHPPPRS